MRGCAGTRSFPPADDERPLLTVLVPVFNERATIREILTRVRALPLSLEVVVVDDGSTDGTRDLLPVLRSEEWIDTLVLQPENRGKGAAIRAGAAKARGRYLVIQDADLEYDPVQIPDLLQPLLEGSADVIYGSRFLGAKRGDFGILQGFGNRFLTALSNVVTGFRLTDMETCYKVVPTELFRILPLSSDRFGFEPELTGLLARCGARIEERPIRYRRRSVAEGKKIGWRDGIEAICTILVVGWKGMDSRSGRRWRSEGDERTTPQIAR